jgi:hypothetical protein
LIVLLRDWDVKVVDEGGLREIETELPTAGVIAPRGGGDVLLNMKPRMKR